MIVRTEHWARGGFSTTTRTAVTFKSWRCSGDSQWFGPLTTALNPLTNPRNNYTEKSFYLQTSERLQKPSACAESGICPNSKSQSLLGPSPGVLIQNQLILVESRACSSSYSWGPPSAPPPTTLSKKISVTSAARMRATEALGFWDFNERQ